MYFYPYLYSYKKKDDLYYMLDVARTNLLTYFKINCILLTENRNLANEGRGLALSLTYASKCYKYKHAR